MRAPSTLAASLVASAAFGSVLAGCGDKKPAAQAEKGADKGAPAASAGGVEVKIGHVAPLTGSIAHLGKDNENGARLAIDEANAAAELAASTSAGAAEFMNGWCPRGDSNTRHAV